MRFERWIPAGLLALAFAAACSTSGELGGGAACDAVCGATPDCHGTSCLAYCLDIEVACATAKDANPAAFSDWVVCQPSLVCTGDGFAEPSSRCALAQIELISCNPSSVGTSGIDSGKIDIPPHDAGTDSHVVTHHDAGQDVGTNCSETGCPTGYTCTLMNGASECVAVVNTDSGCGECQSNCFNGCDEACSGGQCTGCEPDGSCDSSCEDNCGNTCTGGECVCEPDGSCDSSCEDNCGNTCTGGECVCVPNGTCSTSCEDNCGNTCTGGNCVSSCVSTGCTNCTVDCDDGLTCDDNCGNDCCAG